MRFSKFYIEIWAYCCCCCCLLLTRTEYMGRRNDVCGTREDIKVYTMTQDDTSSLAAWIECVRLEYSIFIYTADTLKYWLSAGQHVFDLYIYTIFIWSLSLLPPLRIEEFHHFIWHPAHPWSACHSLLLCEGRDRVIHRESIALYRVLHV